MVYEGMRQQASVIIVPSSAGDSMGLGSLGGVAALARAEEERRRASDREAGFDTIE